MNNFQEKVVQYVQKIPSGSVVSYGQVASEVGSPRLARQVGWTLAKCSEEIPWWRVVNNKGEVSIKNNWTADKTLQKKLLESEGIKFTSEFTFDINKYRWKGF